MSTYAQKTKAFAFAALLAIAVAFGFAATPQGHAYAAGGSQLNAASLGAQDGGDSSTAVALKDGVYKLPNLKAGPSEMFNHFVEDSKILEVSGDTATIKFVTDGSTSSIQKYSKIALGNSADLVQEPYQSELAEGTVIIEGVKQAAEEGDPDKYAFAIDLPRSEVEALLANDIDDDIYITVFNNVGSKTEKKPGWYQASNPIYLSLGELGDATYTLAASNEEKMWKVAQVEIEDSVSGQDYMTVYLTSSAASYPYGFVGTQDEAAASFDSKDTDSRWTTNPVEKKYDPAVSYGTWDNGTATASKAYGHRFPIAIPDGQSEFTVDVVFYSKSGAGFTARRIDVNLDKLEAVGGSAHDVAELTVTSEIDGMAIDTVGSIDYTGYIFPFAGNQNQDTMGLSNDWNSKLTVKLVDNDAYDKAYAVNYETSKPADFDETLGDEIAATDAEYVAIDANGELVLPIVNEYDTKPKTKQLNRDSVTVRMHVADDAGYKEAGTWVERTFKLNFSSRTEATLAITGDSLTVTKFAYDGMSPDFIKTDGSAFGMFKPQDGTTAVLKDGSVEITYKPKNTTVYAGFYLEGLVGDNSTWTEDNFFQANEDGSYTIVLSDDHCGYAYAVAPVKKSDATATTKEQYFLAIPSKGMLSKTAYDGEDINFIKADGSQFGMFTPQDGTKTVLKDSTVEITYFPKNTTVYKGFYLGALISDSGAWNKANFVEANEDGSYTITLSSEYCGQAWPVAPIKKKDGATSSDQYFLAVPAAEKCDADYAAVEAAKAKVPADLSIYTADSAKAVTDAVAAVVLGKKAANQAEVDAMAKAIEDAVAALAAPKASPMKAKAKAVKVKAKKVKKKAQKIAVAKAITVTDAQGKVSYKLSKISAKKKLAKQAKKKIKVAANGKITLKKGLKKGTYKVTIAVTDAGNANYKAATQNVTVKIKVK